MLSRFLNIFKSPEFEDPDKTRHAHNLNTILIALFVAALCWAWYSIFIQRGVQIVVAVGILALLLGLYALLKHGQVLLVGNLLTSLLWLVVIANIAIFGGIRNSGFATLVIIIVIANLALGARAGMVYTMMTIIAGTILVIAENRGLLPVYSYEPNTTILISYGLTALGVGLLLSLTIGDINKALKAAQSAEHSAKEAYVTLEQNRQDLEQRTFSLEQRNATLQIVVEMAQLATRARTETELLEQAVHLLADKLNSEHVGIFLADELEENAVLRAVSSPEGKNLLANNYGLKITSSALLYTSPETEAIKFQRGNRTQYISRPASLPESKTNTSFPIMSGEKLLGLINIQTISPNPWPVEIDTMQIVANQIALSLDNIRLLEQHQQRLQEISHLAGETTQTAWRRWLSGESLGFQYDQLHILPVSETFPEEVHAKLMGQKSAFYVTKENNSRARLIAPIVLRDNVIGVVGYEDTDPQHDWLQTEIILLETIASRVSLALENSRLVAEAEQRAERERIIGQITSRMRETLDFDTILQTAIKEMQRSFELHEAEIRLQAIESLSATKEN